jgi:hypothetical protein
MMPRMLENPTISLPVEHDPKLLRIPGKFNDLLVLACCGQMVVRIGPVPFAS